MKLPDEVIVFKNWRLAHNIGDENHSNYNNRQEIIDCNDPIGFDGIYQNVYDNIDILRNKTGIFFVMGDYIGGDNSFDLPNVPKLEKYCSWLELNKMTVELPGFEIGWHTWSHPDLTKLNKEQILTEIKAPFPTPYFAYPYGLYNDLVIECVKECGYKYAFSVTQGTRNTNDKDWNYKIMRNYI